MYTFILNTMYFLRFKKSSLRLARYWFDSSNCGRHRAGTAFDTFHSDFPRCECGWLVIPGYPHHDCDGLSALDAEMADWEKFKAEQEDFMHTEDNGFIADSSDDEFRYSDVDDDFEEQQDDLREHYADECSRDHHRYCIGGPFNGHWADYGWEVVEPCPAYGRMCAGCPACESPEGRGEYLAWQDMQSFDDDDFDDEDEWYECSDTRGKPMRKRQRRHKRRRARLHG